jgi:hypothetical protein
MHQAARNATMQSNSRQTYAKPMREDELASLDVIT